VFNKASRLENRGEVGKNVLSISLEKQTFSPEFQLLSDNKYINNFVFKCLIKTSLHYGCASHRA